MAVITVARWQVNPGRQQEFMALVGEAKRIHERLGGKVRVWNVTLAGPDSNTISYSVEHKDMTAFGSFTDKLAVDAEWLALGAKAMTPNPTARLLSQSLGTELIV